jgi:hypothetical protein
LIEVVQGGGYDLLPEFNPVIRILKASFKKELLTKVYS